MNSDDYAKYGLARVLGYISTHPLETLGIYLLLKNPRTRTFTALTIADTIQSGVGLAFRTSQRAFKHIVKPIAKKAGQKVAQQFAIQKAASIVSPRAFGWGVGGAVLSLATMGVVIAEGKGQSGIQMAEGQKEYEEHAIRTGGGRGVVI